VKLSPAAEGSLGTAEGIRGKVKIAVPLAEEIEPAAPPCGVKEQPEKVTPSASGTL